MQLAEALRNAGFKSSEEQAMANASRQITDVGSGVCPVHGIPYLDSRTGYCPECDIEKHQEYLEEQSVIDDAYACGMI